MIMKQKCKQWHHIRRDSPTLLCSRLSKQAIRHDTSGRVESSLFYSSDFHFMNHLFIGRQTKYAEMQWIEECSCVFKQLHNIHHQKVVNSWLYFQVLVELQSRFVDFLKILFPKPEFKMNYKGNRLMFFHGPELQITASLFKRHSATQLLVGSCISRYTFKNLSISRHKLKIDK